MGNVHVKRIAIVVTVTRLSCTWRQSCQELSKRPNKTKRWSSINTLKSHSTTCWSLTMVTSCNYLLYSTLQFFRLHCILEFVWKAHLLLFTLWINKACFVHWMTKTKMATCHEQTLLTLTCWHINMCEFNFKENMIKHHTHSLGLLLQCRFLFILRFQDCQGLILCH